MAKVTSFGATLAVGGTPTAVAQVKDFAWSGLGVSSNEATTHDSSSGWAEYVPGVLEPGEITFDVVWDADNTTHDDASGGIYGMLAAKTVDTWTMTMTDTTPTTLAASGFITNLDLPFPVDGVSEGSVTVKMTGAPTWT